MTYENLNIFDTAEGVYKKGNISVCDKAFGKECADADNEFAGMYAHGGYADIHTHGVLGYFFERANLDELITMLKYYASAGTLYIMPTIATISFEDICGATDRILAAAEKIQAENIPAATVIGVHYECRYLNPVKAGAHRREWFADPDIKEADILLGKIREAEKKLGRKLAAHFTLAPEMNGAMEFIKHLANNGATAGIGHSDADYDISMQALNAGAVSFTHTFNQLRPIHHRTSTSLTCALTSDAYTEYICDGFHSLPEIAKLMRRAKDADKMVLITDSTAAGIAEGTVFTSFDGNPVKIDGGVGRLMNGTINGSIITMHKGFVNYINFTGASLEDASKATIINPLKMLKNPGYTTIEEGKPANFVVFDAEYNLKAIFVNGQRIDIATV